MMETVAPGVVQGLGVGYEMSKGVVMDTFCKGICPRVRIGYKMSELA